MVTLFSISRNTGNLSCRRPAILIVAHHKIPIPPKPFQEQIKKIVKEAFEKKKLADQKYELAKQLLEKELGIDKLELKEEKTFEANFSDLNQDKRFDVEFHKPMYSKINPDNA